MHNQLNEKKANIYLGIILGVFAVGIIISLLKNPIPGWDGSVYMSMGKYMLSLGKIGGWEVMRPLMIPLLLGFLWKIGFNMIISAKALAIIFSSLNIFLVYIIGRRLFGNIAGLTAAFFLAITPIFFFQSLFILTGIPSMVFSLLAVYLLIRKANLFFVGIFASLAFLTRFPQGLFFIAILLTIIIVNLKNWKLMLKKISVFSLGFFLPLIPFLIFNYVMYNAYTSNIFVAMIRPMLFASWQQGNPFYPGSLIYYPLNLFMTNPFLIFSIVGIVYFFRKKDYEMPKLLILISLIMFLVYFSCIDSKTVRFALIFLPYLSLFAGLGFSRAISYKKIGRIIFIVSAVILIAASLVGSYMAYNTLREPKDFSVTEFYSYFDSHPIEGTVVITVPQPQAYADVKFEPLYYLVEDHFSRLEEDVSAIMLVASAFPCLEDDLDCIRIKESFFADVRNGTLVFSEEYGGKLHEIYLI